MQNEATLLQEIYERVYGPKVTISNLDDLAADLSHVAERKRPWTGKFLHSLIKGYNGFRANEQLVEALHILRRRLNGADEIQARARQAHILALNELPAETIVLGKARRCAAPGCKVWFVPTHPRQKYHGKVCAHFARRKRRSQGEL
jgi:hypothetical protein